MRLKNTVRNTAFGLISQFINILLNFIGRTVFIYYLGAEYLGVSGLFTSILSILSLTELGLGTAIVYSLYKPISNNDIQSIKQLMNFYGVAYKIIGIFVLSIGIILLPFLDLLIKDPPNIPYFSLIYLMYLSNSGISYFLSYKRSIISATQNEHINTKNNLVFSVAQNILNLLTLIITQNFLLYLFVNILCTILSNIRISKTADTMFPYLVNNKEKLPKEKKKLLFKYVLAQMSHKVGGVVVSGTDNLLMSSYVGVIYVGLYSNYIMIIGIIRNILNIFFSSAMASVGNLNASNDLHQSKTVYKRMLFFNVMLYGITGVCLLLLINDFIYMWIGKKYVLDNEIVFLIMLNYFFTGIRQTTIVYNTTLGLFWNDRFKPWFEAIINLVASIFLLKEIGLPGVFLGTLISTLTTSFWVEPYILFKHGFKTTVKEYFRIIFKYTLVILFLGFVSWYISSLFSIINPIFWLLKSFIIILIMTIGIVFVFLRAEEFQFYVKLAMKLIKSVKSHVLKNS